MKISVCTPLNVENISSRRNSFGIGPHFCQQNEHISVKKMKRTDTCKAVDCHGFSNSDISFTSTSTFNKLVNSVQTSHQPTQSEKNILRSRNGQGIFHNSANNRER